MKARDMVGTRKMETGFVGHGIGELKIAGSRKLNSAVAGDKWKIVPVAGLAKYALVPRIGVGLGQRTEHCVVQIAVAILGSDVGLAAAP